MFGTKISNYTFGQAIAAKHIYMVARVNNERALPHKAIHFVTVLCREFVLGTLFSLGLRCIKPFANVKVSGGQELAQSEENLCS